MKNYEGLYKEEPEKAKVYRKGYLDSVVALAEDAADKKQREREAYISPEKIKKNREKYLSDFKNIIGSPLFDRKVKNTVSKIFVGLDGQGYIYRLVFEFEKNIKFEGLLFVPFDAKEKLPLVVAIHGGEGTPELMSDIYGENYYSHITRRLLDRNVAVFCPQLLIWDGKKFGNKFDRFELDAKFKMLGSSMTSFECECMMGAIDALCENDVIDSEKIGVTGLSYGGYYSLVLAALDSRIKAVYSACVFNDRAKNPRPDFVYANMADKFGDAEMAALIYPRALYIEVGKNDGIFKVNGAITEAERLKNYYADTREKLVFSVTENGHKYSDTDEGIDFLIEKVRIQSSRPENDSFR